MTNVNRDRSAGSGARDLEMHPVVAVREGRGSPSNGDGGDQAPTPQSVVASEAPSSSYGIGLQQQSSAANGANVSAVGSSFDTGASIESASDVDYDSDDEDEEQSYEGTLTGMILSSFCVLAFVLISVMSMGIPIVCGDRPSCKYDTIPWFLYAGGIPAFLILGRI